jgi:hypothetical protein
MADGIGASTPSLVGSSAASMSPQRMGSLSTFERVPEALRPAPAQPTAAARSCVHAWQAHVAPHLQAFAQAYARMVIEPRVLSRKTVFLFAALTGAGKFAAAYGAFLSAEQFRDGHRGIGAVGLCIAAAGTASFLTGAVRFSGAVRRIEPTIGTALKVWSIGGGFVLVAAYACKGLSASRQERHFVRLDYAGRALNFAGVSMMQVSFPAFIASSQAVYGLIVVDRWHRLALGWALLTVCFNASQLAPTAAHGDAGLQVGTQLYTAVCSFWALFGAGLVLSAALDGLGREYVALPPAVAAA